MALEYGEGKALNNAVANHVDDEDKGVTEMMTPCCEMSELEYNAYKTEILDGIENSRLRERTRNVFSWIEEQMKE